MLQRPQIVGHAGLDLFLGQPLGQRDLDRPIERQFALKHLFQGVHGLAHGKVAGQHAAAELSAVVFDPRGQGDFFLARQQRDLGHLAEVHPNRIVRQLGKIFGRNQDRRWGDWLLPRLRHGRQRLDGGLQRGRRLWLFLRLVRLLGRLFD